MVKFSYDFIKAKNEEELKKKLLKLSASSGFTYKIINIYPSGKNVVAWYYADKKQ